MGNVELKKEHKKPVEKLQREVSGSKALITEDIKTTIENTTDALVIRYVDLDDLDTLKKNIESLFHKSVAKSHLIEAATAMFTALRTTSEMKDLERKFEMRRYFRHNAKLYGMELHYAVRGIEKSRKSGRTIHMDTELIVAYMVKLYTMTGDPEDYPEKSEYDELEF